MSALVRSESVTLLSAIESTLGSPPSSGWRQHQPNPDGLQDFYPKIKKVARSPLTKNRQDEKGDIVDLDAVPKVVHDLNKELLDYFGAGIFMSSEKWSGGTNVGRFAVTPAGTGVVALTAFGSATATVASGGALAQNTLVYIRGSGVAGNNGLFVVAAGSTGTTINVTGVTTEASPPTTAMLEVAGFQGTSGDLQINASGNLTSTVLDFTTLGLNVGQFIWIGGGTAASPGALGFATAADRGWAKITAIAAHTLTLARKSATFTTDNGAGKTIQIFYGSFIRNVAIDNGDYLETSYSMELALPGVDTAAATGYVYAEGCEVNQCEINAPLTDKIVATLTFAGMTVTDETTSRQAGASTAVTPLAEAAINTVTEEQRVRVLNQSDESIVSQDISSWKLMVSNNVTPQKQQATFGAARLIVGKCIVTLDLDIFLIQPDPIHRIRDNNSVMWDCALRNNDGATVFDIPNATVEEGAEKFPANGPVTMSPKLKAYRDPTFNYTIGCSRFPFVPAS